MSTWLTPDPKLTKVGRLTTERQNIDATETSTQGKVCVSTLPKVLTQKIEIME